MFWFRVSEAATARLRIQRKRGKRWRKVVTLERRVARPRAVRVRFSGRVGRKLRLRPGRYRVVVVATDRAGNRSAPRRAGFRVVRG